MEIDVKKVKFVCRNIITGEDIPDTEPKKKSFLKSKKQEDSEVSKEDLNSNEEIKEETLEEETISEQTSKEPIVVEEPKRKIICISKIGSDHIFGNKNNHDYAFNLLNMKVVMDGCGSGKHSEVGTKLFAQLFARKAKEYFDKNECINEENFIDVVNSVFEKMLAVSNDISFIFQNYCFTILVCFEFEDEFVVYTCGDGYIIKETKDGISFEVLDDGEYPKYYVYNYIIDKSLLKEYKDGVEFKVTHFSKDDFINVGVATDGLRYSSNLLEVEKNKLMRFLHEGKSAQIEKLINRNNRNEMFHDDISICF